MVHNCLLEMLELTLLASRPKTIDDVSSQEHIVAVLQKTLTSSNASYSIYWYNDWPDDDTLAAPHAVLWPSRHGEDLHNFGPFATTIWVRHDILSAFMFLDCRYYSPDNFKNRVLELNASDERGISIVREKIKNFARQTPRAQAVASDGKTYPCPPYKIIILDEADSMTQDAQSALRRIMETYARITRFCLVCNYVTRCVSIAKPL